MAVLSPTLTVNGMNVVSLTPQGNGLFTAIISVNLPTGVMVTINAANVPTAPAQQLATALTAQSAITMTLT